VLLATAILIFGAGSAYGGETLASGSEISKAISGNTVQGTMVDSSSYTEFYATDGTIKGDGYSGVWRIRGNTMCFDYGEDPEACWHVSIDGDQVFWIKGGLADGYGTIVSGNPNNF
ncbi:MAG: hypothetical protein R3245_11985, partial [Kiloniellales bacterium]|nr:hypothetical protein [Kiloniellales bacterium]